MGRLWRLSRSWKLRWGLLVFLCFVGVLNLLRPPSQGPRVATRILMDHSPTSSARGPHAEGSSSHMRTSAASESTRRKVIVLPRLQGRGEMASSPAVQKELSLGVKEEENSAREVLDGEPAGKDGVGQEPREGGGAGKGVGEDVTALKGEGHPEDANAAHEIHSGEPEIQHSGRRAEEEVKDEDKVRQEQEAIELSYHQLPPQQGEDGAMNWRNLSADELGRLSVLGRRLYLGERIGTPKAGNFTILVWKTGPSVERRLLRQFGKEKKDPFAQCSVRNCEITYEDAAASTADAILIHLHRTKGPHSFPNRTRASQRWIWLSDESPYHTFLIAKDKDISHYNGYFNWSMTYRMDSDIPVPYGRTIKLSEGERPKDAVDYFSAKPKTVAIMGSNCGGRNNRWKYVKELQKYLKVDAYGKCGTLKCPGHFTKDCASLNDYKFYLSFENSDCQEYITEKAWWNALGKGAVPVVMGGPVATYKKMLPPNSFLHVDDFDSPEDLARHLLALATDPKAYNRLHAWRSQYRISNEHGYFESPVYHYCRICEALNYNDPKPKSYDRMQDFWNKEEQCFSSTWGERLKRAQG
ncbi:glycoprotein 3-alpha-L-fucosyltransferase A-like isoform X2 [Penaeus japonicus]|nr:glycoprotein 3-alpha-L-fucosyltransferase A-like isoform X2 [Penaeus japonicus]XP_042855624.1 glycoprotein 3-alpha-L-fucosyltransferase A-like isoform X2 [Penaeus japonicus]